MATVILGGARTPFGRMSGSLASLSAVDLGVIAAKAAIEHSGIEDTDIDHVIMGQVLQAGVGQNPARQVTLRAGLDRTVTAETINRVCGSGLRAISLADMQIRLGEGAAMLAGGMESMSNAPYALPGARAGYRMGDGQLIDLMVHDGLTCAIANVHMGIHGGSVATEIGISREDQDAWALRSHQRALDAMDRGWLAEEIVPVDIVGRKGTTIVDTDEAPRRDTSAEVLAKLKPAFDPSGTVTAGNAPGVNDGAAVVVVADSAIAQARGVTPLAEILSSGQSAWDAPYLAFTPEMAIRNALEKADLAVDDVDLFEINEAFASVAMISTQRLGVDPEKVNVNGGAVAFGHPIGASGARLVVTIINELKRRGGGIGAVGICSGGGQGDAMILRVLA
ncbi:MAG: acetyl-CoA C-acetyltransferase [Thermomicrobiales bacterium]|nr:acetyl-CoA C-acetyltransferase [Thermomicrobiales bacterium]MCO5225747.1 acetyl-CoA C-acetyltransferase [Thermomicrobiales bacterium]MCO5228016.1 acetyl-CoA C-acetyltransferase [Thermomicrobiales bacterium]